MSMYHNQNGSSLTATWDSIRNEMINNNLTNFNRKPNATDVDEFSRFSRPMLTIAAILTVFIMLIGIIGNLLTVIALIKCPKVRNVAAAFIINLCVADFLFCCVVLPFNAFRFMQGTWTHGDFLCQAIPFIQYGNIGVSLLCIAMITINRYIMITHHSAYSKIYQPHWIAVMIIFCWILSYGMQFPTLFKVWGEFGYDPNLCTCSILNDKYGRSSKTFLFVTAFLIPCLIIIGCYARIFWVVHQSELRLRNHSKAQHSIPNNLRPVPSATVTQETPSNNNNNNQIISQQSDVSISSNRCSTTSPGNGNKLADLKSNKNRDHQREQKAKRNEWRITKMVLAIFLSFVLCYLPITIAKIADTKVKFPGFHIFGYIMLYLSACINPIIYVIMNKQYRQAYKTIILCRAPRILSFTNIGSSLGEKWKDIGYSYNHSRTMVSQVSIVDPDSFHNSQIRPDSPHPKRLTVIPDSKDEDNHNGPPVEPN